MEKLDISSKADIKKLIDGFYEKVIKDPEIGTFFTEVVAVDWNKHLPVIYIFWESMLLDTYEYRGNPMKKHVDLNQMRRL